MRHVHQRDPDRLPDDRFDPGTLAHLVPGNRGRFLDPRRTPARVVSLDWRTGHFTVEIEAFEDRGARWEIPFEKVGNLQFAKDARRAVADEVEGLAARAAELDRPLRVPVDPARRSTTQAAVERPASRRRSDGSPPTRASSPRTRHPRPARPRAPSSCAPTRWRSSTPAMPARWTGSSRRAT
jgi:hypothetical protein